LGEIRRRVREVILTVKRERQKMTRERQKMTRERQKMTIDVREKVRKRVAELRSASRRLIATSRHWRTGRP
jgi:hypothetical protein